MRRIFENIMVLSQQLAKTSTTRLATANDFPDPEVPIAKRRMGHTPCKREYLLCLNLNSLTLKVVSNID